jgi:hypothetical protein
MQETKPLTSFDMKDSGNFLNFSLDFIVYIGITVNTTLMNSFIKHSKMAAVQ